MTRITLRHRNMGDCQGVKIAGSIPARFIYNGGVVGTRNRLALLIYGVSASGFCKQRISRFESYPLYLPCKISQFFIER